MLESPAEIHQYHWN